MVDIFGGTMQVCGGGVLIDLLVYIYFLFSFFFKKFIIQSVGSTLGSTYSMVNLFISYTEMISMEKNEKKRSNAKNYIFIS
jgi:hypothetical protein